MLQRRNHSNHDNMGPISIRLETHGSRFKIFGCCRRRRCCRRLLQYLLGGIKARGSSQLSWGSVLVFGWEYEYAFWNSAARTWNLGALSSRRPDRIPLLKLFFDELRLIFFHNVFSQLYIPQSVISSVCPLIVLGNSEICIIRIPYSP